MSLRRTRRTLAVALLLLASADALAAQGRLGFGVEVDTSGLLSPVLDEVKVARVRPGSAAEAAGLRTGDRILDIDGQAVRGAPARPMAARLQKVEAGQHVRLRILRGGVAQQLELVARPVR